MRTLLLLVLPLVFVACSSPMEPRERQGKGGRYYGGVLNANETEELRGMFPLSLVQAASHRIASQVYEGLVRFDPNDLGIQPSLAASWSVDPTGTVYTFQLREGVRFHDDPCFPGGKGREMRASDVLKCFTALCSPGEQNQMFWLFQDRVVGANAHYGALLRGATSEGVKGLETLDDHTVRITLTNPWPGFLYVLAHQGCWIYPEELVAHHGAQAAWHPVGTGPFRLKTFRRGESLILERHPEYWGQDAFGNGLPFLDAVRYTFVQDKEKELEEFRKGNLSLVYELPVGHAGSLDEFANGPYQLQEVPGLTVQFYGFNAGRPPFNDVLVRRAFTLAVDRKALVDSVLAGLALPASRGVVPPGFTDYPYEQVPELLYDPDSARALLRAAGYPGGKGIPTVFLQVNNDGFGYIRVASEVQGMLERNLGVRVVSSVLPADQHFQRIERGEAAFWREGWIADHPDPENFLALFHGRNVPVDSAEPSYLNSTRYRNARFDSLYMRSMRESNNAGRLALLSQAERQLMEDAVVIPLYYERSVRLLQPWVQDLPINGMEYRDLGAVWFDPARRERR
jgi:oligopeptide transport system substrate-binding protein